MKAIHKDISDFYLAGINYKKIDAGTRGQFSIGNERYAAILSKAHSYNVEEVFVLSTCNRTEIYGFAENFSDLTNLLCSETTGSHKDFNNFAYIKRGSEAIRHLFEVAAGLDSQILGDYEIVGQIKSAVRTAKENGFISPLLERIINCVLRSSKAIKNQTSLSSGTVSVSFAAVQYIKEKVKDVRNKKILLIGTGKIGRNTTKNLIDYLGQSNITLVNRTEEKASQLAKQLNLNYGNLEDLPSLISSSEIIIVATNADDPVLLASHINTQEEKVIIDLSVPCNVEKSIELLTNIKMIDVDALCKLKDETLAKRQEEVPKAKAIITEHFNEFIEWNEMRKHAPVLKAVKSRLKEIYLNNHTPTEAEEKVQKILNGMASKLKEVNKEGNSHIEAIINEYLSTGGNL